MSLPVNEHYRREGSRSHGTCFGKIVFGQRFGTFTQEKEGKFGTVAKKLLIIPLQQSGVGNIDPLGIKS